MPSQKKTPPAMRRNNRVDLGPLIGGWISHWNNLFIVCSFTAYNWSNGESISSGRVFSVEDGGSPALWRLDQMMGDGEKRKFQAGGYASLVKDVGQVALDRFFAQAELLGDVAIAAAFDD